MMSWARRNNIENRGNQHQHFFTARLGLCTKSLTFFMSLVVGIIGMGNVGMGVIFVFGGGLNDSYWSDLSCVGCYEDRSFE